jgi:hypothetical protein
MEEREEILDVYIIIHGKSEQVTPKRVRNWTDRQVRGIQYLG